MRERLPTAILVARLNPSGFGIVKTLPETSALHVLFREFLVSDGFQSESCDGKVCGHELQLPGSIEVSCLEICLQTWACLELLTFRARHLSTSSHDFYRSLFVELLCSPDPCVCHDDARRVAFHDVCLPVGNHPARERASSLLGKIDVRLGDVGSHIRFKHAEQLRLCAISIPVAESRVLLGARLMHLFVGSHILSVDIASQAGVYESMVKVRVELCNAALVLSLYLDATQVFVPLSLSSSHHFIKVPSQIICF